MSNWVEVGAVEEIPKRGSRVLQTPDGDVAIFRTADDAIFALRDKCPHKDGPLSQGIVHGHTVTCPLHNWKISLDSGEAQGPDEGCTGRYEVKVDAGRISVELKQ